MTKPSFAASDVLIVDVGEGTAEIRLNRPHKLNALTEDMLCDLASTLRGLSSRDDVGAIILTGEGRAFSAGDDLEASLTLTRAGFLSVIEAFQDVTRALAESPVAVIAALNGIAVGGAAEISLACDVRIGTTRSEMLFPENGIGLTMSNGSSQILPRILGGRAIGLILLQQRLLSDDLMRLGLMDHCVDDAADLMGEARRFAAELSRFPTVTSLHMSALRLGLPLIEQALASELDSAMRAWDSGEVLAGIQHFWARKAAAHAD